MKNLQTVKNGNEGCFYDMVPKILTAGSNDTIRKDRLWHSFDIFCASDVFVVSDIAISQQFVHFSSDMKQ